MSRTIPVPQAGDALLAVDIQHDFLPGGALGVREGDAVIPVLNAWIEAFERAGRPVFLTRDWHPADHCSFQAQGGPWPPHCVAGSAGAEFSRALHRSANPVVISKATTREAEAYSAFAGTDLAERLRARNVERIYVGGLATDYCVLNTVLDALAAGFRVVVIEDAIRPVDVHPGDGAAAIDEMRRAGADFASAVPVE
jgi:nicotinamidase/pyrazinamidase